jgi:hypothetical protein
MPSVARWSGCFHRERGVQKMYGLGICLTELPPGGRLPGSAVEKANSSLGPHLDCSAAHCAFRPISSLVSLIVAAPHCLTDNTMSEDWWQKLEEQCSDVLSREGTPDSDRVHSGHQAGTAPSDERLELLRGLQAYRDLQIVWRLHMLIPEILIAILEFAGKDAILNLQGALTKLLKDYQRLSPEQKRKLPDPRVPERLSGLPTVIAALNKAEVAVERKMFAPTSFDDIDRWLERSGLVTETAKLPLLDLSRLKYVSLVN